MVYAENMPFINQAFTVTYNRNRNFESAGRPFESGRVRHLNQRFSEINKIQKAVINGRVTADKKAPQSRKNHSSWSHHMNREFRVHR
jgi:hypothetical protein